MFVCHLAPILACDPTLILCCQPRPLPVPVYGTALPLFVYCCILIKLQMDPLSTDPSLQKTSPHSDPAALVQISTELSAQASQLAMHHHQLNRLTSLTEELVKTLQSLRLIPAEAATPPPTATASAFPTPPAVIPRLALLEKSDGTPAKCVSFFNALCM